MIFAQEARYTQFPNRRLLKLLIPLLVEQSILVAVSFIDAIMLSSIHQDAYSAISLVDMINLLVMQVFMAIGAGGAIVAAQLIGKRDREGALNTANQTVMLVLVVSVTLAALTLALNNWLLRLIYPTTSESIMGFARQYFALSAVSYPAYALFNSGANLLYAQGNSRSSMVASFSMNVLKVLLNLLLIKVFSLGVWGIGLATILSRVLGAWMVTRVLLDPHSQIHYRRPLDFKALLRFDRRILKVAGPSGVENTLFLFGKLIIGTIIAGLSSTMIAANAASNTLSTLINIPCNALNLATITVVGQCIGAGLQDEAEYNAKRLLRMTFAAQFVTSGLLFLFVRPVVGILNLNADTADITAGILRLYCILTIPFEPLAFGLPNSLRASGDNKYTMYAAILSMVVFRVGFSYLFVYGFNFGIQGIWYAMYLDWVARSAFFLLRFKSGKWKKHSLV